MKPALRWTFRGVGLLAIAGAVLVAPVRSQTPVPCQATVRGDYRTEEVFDNWKNKVFMVEIASEAPCAKVFFDLVTTERLFNGEEINSTTAMWRKVTAGEEPAFKVLFKMAKDSELVDWQIQYRSCEVCGN